MGLNQQQTIKSAPEDMKEWLEVVTRNIKFKKWDADASWDGSIGKMLIVKCDLSDVDAMSKRMNIPKKTVSNHKVVDINLKDYLGKKLKGKVHNVRFRETSKKTGSKAPDAKTTAKQEQGSKYVFEYALANRKSGWPTLTAFKSDKKMLKGLTDPKIYPDVDDDWLNVFFLQHKVILDKFSKSEITKFDWSGTNPNSFMKVISDAVRDLGVPKKDNWNPSDIWGVRGSSASVIKRVKDAVEGGTETQTIQELNTLLRSMYKSKELVGISLKKVSGKEAKWEEYNIEKLTLKEVNDYRFNVINIVYNLKASPDGKTQSLDTKVELRQSGGGAEYNFQITSNDTAKPNQNLKFESKPIGSSKARGGKAEIKQVEKVVESLIKLKGGGTFKNKHQNYPDSLGAWGESNGKNIAKYKKYFEHIQNKVTTDVRDSDEFAKVIALIFSGDKPWVAQSKLMQLEFLYYAFHIKPEKKYSEFWTDMLFLSIKKGDRFGPFGKLY